MKKIYTFLLTLSLATVTTKASTYTVKHTVKKGETLSGIARKHHTSIAKVRQANGLKKSDVIKFGKVLKVPTSSYTAKKKIPVASTTYVIKRGDTLSGIARKHHTSIAKVRQANGLKKSDVLKFGKVLKVPTSSYTAKKKIPVASTKYVIKSGDTLSGIARKHRTTIAKVRTANGLKKSETIKIGQVLKVPKNSKAIRYTKTKKKASNKKLARSFSNLDTISLENTKVKKRSTFSFSDIFSNSTKENADKCQRITSLAKTKLGKKYVWGASGNKNTYDCSSFVKYVYKKQGIELPRTSIMQSKVGKYVKRDELQKGDLIFFDTSKRRKGYVNHVGIYLGDNKFIHASSAKKKVVVSNLSKFYGQRYKGARRPS